MKKVSAKKVVKKNDTDTELLARQIADGFGEMRTSFEAVDKRFDAVEYRLLSLEKGQSEAHHILEVIERKQMGMLHSLDETVHQSEFRKLVQRVEVLEK